MTPAAKGPLVLFITTVPDPLSAGLITISVSLSAAVLTHFNLPDHSIEDMTLIPLELQPNFSKSRRKAREAYLIHRGKTLEPSGMNGRNER